MIVIEPITFPILGTATQIKIQINSHETTAKTCQLYYVVLTEENKKVIEDNYNLTEEEFSAWGEDNTFVENIVLTKLGLVRKPEVIKN